MEPELNNYDSYADAEKTKLEWRYQPWVQYSNEKGELIIYKDFSDDLTGEIVQCDFTISTGTLIGGTFDGKVTNDLGTIRAGTFNSTTENRGIVENGTFNGSFANTQDGTIKGGTFYSVQNFTNEGTISGGEFLDTTNTIVNKGLVQDSAVFLCDVQNGEYTGGSGGGGEGGGGGREWSAPITDHPVVFAAENSVMQATIDGGTFAGEVTNYALITGGVFKNAIVNETSGTITPEAQTLTATNASVTINDVFEQTANTPTYVVGEKTVTVQCDSSTFAGKRWKITNQSTEAVTYSKNNPVEIEMPGDANVTLELVDETKPTEPTENTKYKLTVVGADSVVDDEGNDLVENNKVAENTPVNIKAPETDPSGMVFSRWVIDEPDGVELSGGFDRTKNETQFLMPKSNLTLHAEYITPDQSGQDDDFVSTAAAVVGGAALTGLVAWNGYNIFAEVYMKQVWPALPENRGELAISLWHDADEPAAVDPTLYTDLEEDNTEGQTAGRWAVENDLMKPADKDDPDVFRPYRPVTPGQVYRAWKKLQKMKEQQS